MDILTLAPQLLNLKSGKLAYCTIHGSRAYGLNTPESDYDLRGFFIPDFKHVLGFVDGPEHYVVQRKDGEDTTVYDIRKFFRLAAACNPNVIEVLYTNMEDHLYQSWAADQVLLHREMFLSKKAFKAFGGYATSQFQKIQNKNWDDPAVRKDAMHCLRLLEFGADILACRNLSVRFTDERRPGGMNRESLMKVRSGETSMTEVLKQVEWRNENMVVHLRNSHLPEEPDYEALNDLLTRIFVKEYDLKLGV